MAQVCATSITPLPNSSQQLNLLTCAGQWLIGTQQVAWLNFTAATNQSSAFAGLSFTNLAGYMPDGTAVANFAPQSGRVVVLGEEPLLEMAPNTNAQPLLMLYGKPATNYTVEWRTNLLSGKWQPVLANLVVGTNLLTQLGTAPGSGPNNFYRAVRLAAPGTTPSLSMFMGTNGQLALVLRGQPGYVYGIERTPSLSPPQWTLWQQIPFTNSAVTIYVTPTGPRQFFRARLIGLALPEEAVGLGRTSGTNAFLSFSGVAGRPYRVQFTPALSPPAWETLATNAPSADGLFQFIDTNGWGQTQRFYRLVWP